MRIKMDLPQILVTLLKEAWQTHPLDYDRIKQLERLIEKYSDKV